MAKRGRPATEICRDRPILFSAPMVRAILCGDKTETRRVIRHQPEWANSWVLRDASGLCKDGIVRGIRCLYGCVGDTLWVKETWGAVAPYDSQAPLEECRIEYRADLPPGCTDFPGQWPAEDARGNPDAPKWRPSIFLPKRFSRISLHITGLNVQKIQDIRIDGIIAEGLKIPDVDYSVPERPDVLDYERECYAYDKFQELWDQINSKRGFSFESNPRVWIVQFRRTKP